MERKNSFLIYLDYEEHFKCLTDAELGRLIMGIIQYEKNQKIPELSGSAKLAFSFIKRNLDIDRKKYEKRCEQNRINGRKGGRPPKNYDNIDNFQII